MSGSVLFDVLSMIQALIKTHLLPILSMKGFIFNCQSIYFYKICIYYSLLPSSYGCDRPSQRSNSVRGIGPTGRLEYLHEALSVSNSIHQLPQLRHLLLCVAGITLWLHICHLLLCHLYTGVISFTVQSFGNLSRKTSNICLNQVIITVHVLVQPTNLSEHTDLSCVLFCNHVHDLINCWALGRFSFSLPFALSFSFSLAFALALALLSSLLSSSRASCNSSVGLFSKGRSSMANLHHVLFCQTQAFWLLLCWLSSLPSFSSFSSFPGLGTGNSQGQDKDKDKTSHAAVLAGVLARLEVPC